MWIRSEIGKMVTTRLSNQLRNTHHARRTRKQERVQQREREEQERVQQREMYGRSCGAKGNPENGWNPETGCPYHHDHALQENSGILREKIVGMSSE